MIYGIVRTLRTYIQKVYYKLLYKLIKPVINLYYEFFVRKTAIITASVTPYCRNWGDDVSIVLCKLINPNVKFIVRRYTWNLFNKDDFLCIGSIITWMSTNRSIIWGSGIVYPDKEISSIPKKVMAVRGPLTRDYLLKRGIDCPTIYGDPALLFPRYYTPAQTKKYSLGIIPHFRDKTNPLLDIFKNDKSVLIIDVQKIDPWTQFIDDICSCEYIASSSLHGIIISDAYNIPNVWVSFPNGERKNFAFDDYFSSVGKSGITAYELTVENTRKDIINQCQNWKPNDIDLDKLLSVCPFNTL